MNDIINKYINARKELIEYLGICENYNVVFHDEVWSGYSDHVEYFDSTDEEYGYDVVNNRKSEAENHTTFLVDNGCGDTFYAVFNNNKKEN